MNTMPYVGITKAAVKVYPLTVNTHHVGTSPTSQATIFRLHARIT
jgi:hypothetical protein